MGSALRVNREFRLLWAGQAISALGSQISFVAYPLLALAVTGSPAKAGIVGFAFNVPVALLALPAGALADRVNRKHLMIASDAVRQLIEPDLLGEAVARNEARMFGAMLVGPPLGGLLFGLGRAIPFLADSISYAASVISKLLIKADCQDVRIDTDPKSARGCAGSGSGRSFACARCCSRAATRCSPACTCRSWCWPSAAARHRPRSA